MEGSGLHRLPDRHPERSAALHLQRVRCARSSRCLLSPVLHLHQHMPTWALLCAACSSCMCGRTSCAGLASTQHPASPRAAHRLHGLPAPAQCSHPQASCWSAWQTLAAGIFPSPSSPTSSPWQVQLHASRDAAFIPPVVGRLALPCMHHSRAALLFIPHSLLQPLVPHRPRAPRWPWPPASLPT